MPINTDRKPEIPSLLIALGSVNATWIGIDQHGALIERDMRKIIHQ